MSKIVSFIFTLAAIILVTGIIGALWVRPSLTNDLLFALFALALVAAAWYGGFSWGRKASEPRTRQLLETEEKFQKIFDSNMIGILFSDREGRILDANDYFLNLLGYTREELQEGSVTWRDFTAPDSMDQSLRNFNLVKQGLSAPPFEKEYIRKDGSRVQVYLGTAAMNDSRARTAVIILDISERKRAEQKIAQTYIEMENQVNRRTQEIRESRHFLDSVIENIPNMIFVKDAQDLRFIRFNRAGEELLGYPREELLGKNDFDFFPREQAEHFIAADKAVLASNKVVDVPEEPINTRDGQRLLHTKKIPLFDKDGHPQYLLGISEDITAKKAAENQRYHLLQEQAAREEAERSAQQLAFLAQASKELSRSLNYRETVQAFTQVVTRSLGDFCSVHLLDESGLRVLALSHRDRKTYEAILDYRRRFPVNWVNREGLKNVLTTGEFELYENFTDETLRRPHLSDEDRNLIRFLNFRATMVIPLKFYGKTLGAMAIATNDPTRRYSSFDLSLAQELAKRASLALENAQLYEKAQEANRAKTSFLANMSHEIRTPLGAMIGFAELVLEAPDLNTENVQSLETILRNGRQLLRIVDEILDISKVESDRLNIENIRFPLLQVVEDVNSLLSFQAKEKGLKFTFTALSELPEFIVSDPLRLRQILINVIGNAIKFTENGSVDVTVRADPLDSPERQKLTFAIHDSGVGISPEQERRLFQPFAQGDSSMTRKFGGTGLGLFLSRKLALALGGNLVLTASQLGQGSTFVVTVEAKVSAAELSPPIAAPEEIAPKIIDANPHQALKVLVVEDAADNRALIGRYINMMGFECDFAEDGFQGVEKALHGDFDLVLMDIQMPGMDGFEALQKLKQSHFKPPVIALTAHAMKGDRERCLESGFDGYLMKPVHRHQLQDILAHYSQEKA